MFEYNVWADDIGVKIIGYKFEPQGAFEHLVFILITTAFFTFAVYGFKTFVRKVYQPEEKD